MSNVVPAWSGTLIVLVEISAVPQFSARLFVYLLLPVTNTVYVTIFFSCSTSFEYLLLYSSCMHVLCKSQYLLVVTFTKWSLPLMPLISMWNICKRARLKTSEKVCESNTHSGHLQHFILLMLVGWSYWWISRLDLWTKGGCLLFPSPFSLPPLCAWRSHSLSCTARSIFILSMIYGKSNFMFPSVSPLESHHLCILYVANVEFNVSKRLCHKIIWWLNKGCVPRRGPTVFLPPKQ